MLLSPLFNGRLPPMNLSRPSSFATANAPEANLGSREEDGNMQANLQRRSLRTQACHCCWVTTNNEESSPSASGSAGLQNLCATHAGSQSSSCTIAARAWKLIRAEMISFAVDSEVACPQAQFPGSYENLTGSGSEMEIPLSTAKTVLCCGLAYHH